MKNKNIQHTILFALAALPLLLYPFVLMAGIFSLAAQRSGNFLLNIISDLFFLSYLVYPITYFTCMVINIRNKSGNKRVVLFPFLHLLLVVLFLVLWLCLERVPPLI